VNSFFPTAAFGAGAFSIRSIRLLAASTAVAC